MSGLFANMCIYTVHGLFLYYKSINESQDVYVEVYELDGKPITLIAHSQGEEMRYSDFCRKSGHYAAVPFHALNTLSSVYSTDIFRRIILEEAWQRANVCTIGYWLGRSVTLFCFYMAHNVTPCGYMNGLYNFIATSIGCYYMGVWVRKFWISILSTTPNVSQMNMQECQECLELLRSLMHQETREHPLNARLLAYYKDLEWWLTKESRRDF